MADSIKLPVELVGLETAFKRIIDAHNKAIAQSRNAASTIAQTMTQLNKTLAGELRGQGVTTGKFSVAAKGLRASASDPESMLDVNVIADMAQITKSHLRRAAQITRQEAKVIQDSTKIQEGITKAEEAAALNRQRLRDAIVRTNAILAQRSATTRIEQHNRRVVRNNSLQEQQEQYQEHARRYNWQIAQDNIRRSNARMDRRARIAQSAAQWEAHQEQFDNDRIRRRHAAMQRMSQMQRSRDQRMSAATMGIASGGIGLFGQAGFPLLNIAFASMSGMKYAGIAAVATAAGEAARAIMALQDAALQSAEQLGFITKNFKYVKGELEAAKAFWGGLLTPSVTRTMQERTDLLRNKPAIAAMWMMGGEARSRVSNAWMSPDRMKELLSPGKFISSITLQTMRDVANLPRDLAQMRKSMNAQLNQYTAKFESPEEMWRRIQQSAAGNQDAIRDQRMVIQKQMMLIDQQIESTKNFSKAVDKLLGWIPGGKENAAGAPTTFGGAVKSGMSAGFRSAFSFGYL